VKAVIYARLAEENPDRLTQQIEMLMQEVQKNPLIELSGVYSEFSNGITETPPSEMQKMVQDCMRKGIRLVIVRDMSRIAGGYYDFAKRIKWFHRHNIAVWFVGENRSSLNMTKPVPVSEIFK